MYRGDDIIIDQLFVRANQKQVARCVNQLELSSWDFNTQGRWIFVKNISVKSPERQLRLAASEKLKQLIYRANSRSGDKSSQEVVVFDDFSKLLAELIGDIYTGKFGYCWYWKKWHYLINETKNVAITRVLFDNSTYLPDVFSELLNQNVLIELVSSLSEVESKHILYQLDEQLPAFRTIENNTKDRSEDANQISVALDIVGAIKSNKRIYEIIKEISNQFSVHDIRLHLLLTVYLRTLTPTICFKATLPFVTRLVALMQSEEKIINNSASGSERKIENVHWRDDSSTQAETIEFTNDSENETRAVDKAWKSQTKARKSYPKAVKQGSASDSISTPIENRATPGMQLAPSPSSVRIEPEVFQSDKVINLQSSLVSDSALDLLFEHDFISNTAGVFYLLNLLRTPKVTELMQSTSEIIDPWYLIFDLGRILAIEYDEPINQFFSQAFMLFRDGAIDDLPREPFTMSVYYLLLKDNRVNQYLNRRYFEIPGRVKVTTAHLDCYFNMDLIDLDVRLAGLDVNPGWLPWLGKVVNFYYTD